MTTQPKTTVPTDADLKGNPGIGASKGTTIAGTTPDDLADDLADSTIEGDSENGTNAAGGIDKADANRGPKDRA
ncbi:hypothetical protein P7D22_15575 [Lichenihabitans sp. Uapishka_5]|uniref:hypothetical protein n=1 Tax=Lichenihabitans sp. Uapishka_5 TaxID=3037302 RepID=UPI0029E7F9FA|nr:hypothetical protein [Lichenihabitans sp. Uapishka_5]MDX7952590.1 hypothetical protein [Lichenihabitans sp. Uapishka_5]